MKMLNNSLLVFCFEEKEITKDGKNYQENCLPWHIQHRG